MFDKKVSIGEEAFSILKEAFLKGIYSNTNVLIDFSKTTTITISPFRKGRKLSLSPPISCYIRKPITLQVTISELRLEGESLYIEVDNSVIDVSLVP